MTIGDETRTIGIGDATSFLEASSTRRSGPDGPSLVLDIFSPPREDYKES